MNDHGLLSSEWVSCVDSLKKGPKCDICHHRAALFITADSHSGEWRLECLECEPDSNRYWIPLSDMLSRPEWWGAHLCTKTWFRPALLRSLCIGVILKRATGEKK